MSKRNRSKSQQASWEHEAYLSSIQERKRVMAYRKAEISSAVDSITDAWEPAIDSMWDSAPKSSLQYSMDVFSAASDSYGHLTDFIADLSETLTDPNSSLAAFEESAGHRVHHVKKGSSDEFLSAAITHDTNGMDRLLVAMLDTAGCIEDFISAMVALRHSTYVRSPYFNDPMEIDELLNKASETEQQVYEVLMELSDGLTVTKSAFAEHSPQDHIRNYRTVWMRQDPKEAVNEYYRWAAATIDTINHRTLPYLVNTLTQRPGEHYCESLDLNWTCCQAHRDLSESVSWTKDHMNRNVRIVKFPDVKWVYNTYDDTADYRPHPSVIMLGGIMEKLADAIDYHMCHIERHGHAHQSVLDQTDDLRRWLNVFEEEFRHWKPSCFSPRCNSSHHPNGCWELWYFLGWLHFTNSPIQVI